MNQPTSPVSEPTFTIQARYPRIFLTSNLRELKVLENCKVVWPSGFESDIFDFGRSSVSVYFPMRLNLQFFKGDIVKLGFRLGGQETFFVDTRVIRAETRLLSVELLRVSPSNYKLIDQWLSNDFLASHFQEVHRSCFSPEQTFQHWYHGPLDSNLYAWVDNEVLTRLCLELRDSVYVWDSQGWMMGESRTTLSYPTEDYTYHANFLATLHGIKDIKDIKPAIQFLDRTGVPVWKTHRSLVHGS